MRQHLRLVLMTALFGSTALVPAAYAQDAGAGQQGQGCDALGTLIDDHRDRLREDWITEANDVIASSNAAQCADLHEQAVAALDLDEQMQSGANKVDSEDAQRSAQIIVTQPDPDVTIEQQAPQVAVSQGQPSVSIDQGQPEILVRQQSPTVTVQVPQPVITIDQPQPEIIIRMPDPRVAVSTPQPQVEVRQGEPRVSVEQAEPRVSVRGDEQPDDANVDVQQGDPNVQLQTAEGQPQIDIQRQEPRVQFETAEPNIDVQMTGEPDIRFSQTGEPTVRFEDFRGEDQQTAQASGQQAMPEELDNQQTAQADLNQQDEDETQTGSIQQDEAQAQARQGEQQDVLALIMADGEPMEEGELQEYAASDLIGRNLVNADGVELGTVELLVEAGDRRYVVLGADSVLGDGQNGVVLPLDNVQVSGDDQLMFRGLTEQEYAQLQQYDGSNVEQIAADATIEVATL